MECTNKKKILIIGDSLCLPRNKPEIVKLSDTWPYLLKNNNQFEIIQLSIGGGTIKNLYEQSVYYEGYDPDVVIIQSGIVDCAPRALSWLEKELINSNRILSYLFSHLMPINLMRKYRKLTYTKQNDYKKFIKEFTIRFSNCKIIFIGIIPASNEYEAFLPNVSQNIKCFNEIIKKQINAQKDIFLNTANIPMSGIMSDYHHLNTIGHNWLSEQVLSLIKFKN
jgi:hypothetical protein